MTESRRSKGADPFNAAGYVTRLTAALGRPEERTVRYTRTEYDDLDRVVRRTDPQEHTSRYEYDPLNNLLSFTDPKNRVTAFAYDARNRLASRTDAELRTESYLYDGEGHLLFHTDRENLVTGYDYDALGRRIRGGFGATATTAPVYTSTITYGYDAADRLTTVQDSVAGTLLRSYDDRFDTLSAETTPDGTPIGDLSYTYDADGTRTALGGSLARSGLPTAIADAQYDANNRLTQKDGVAYTYDGHGQLTGDGVSTYTWNARHQLTGISGPDTLGFGYDGLGRRRSLTVNGQTTVTLYDGWNPIQLQEHGAAVENRLMGLGLDAIYTRVRGGQVETYLTDALGSVLELRDAAQARTVSYTYDPYV